MALSTGEAAEKIKESSRVSGGTSADQSGATIPLNPWGSFDRLVVIDSTWNGTNKILKVDSNDKLFVLSLMISHFTFFRTNE